MFEKCNKPGIKYWLKIFNYTWDTIKMCEMIKKTQDGIKQKFQSVIVSNFKNGNNPFSYTV